MKNFLIIMAVLGAGVGIGYFISTRDTNPCIAEEKNIRQRYEEYAERNGTNETIRGLVIAKMYEDLAANGCEHHRNDYANRAVTEMMRVNAALTAEQNAISGAIVIDMNEVANTVNEVTREMADAIGGFIDRVKNTRINVTVEQK